MMPTVAQGAQMSLRCTGISVYGVVNKGIVAKVLWIIALRKVLSKNGRNKDICGKNYSEVNSFEIMAHE